MNKLFEGFSPGIRHIVLLVGIMYFLNTSGIAAAFIFTFFFGLFCGYIAYKQDKGDWPKWL